MNIMNTNVTHRLATRYVLTALVLFCLVQTAAFATFVTYTNRALFLSDAATASLTATNEDFSTAPTLPTFSITDGSNGVTLTDNTVGGTPIAHTGSELIVPNVGVILDLGSTAVTGTVFGIGYDFISIAGPGASLSLNSGAATVSTSAGSGFLGILSTDGMTISTVDSLISSTALQFANPRVDNIVIVTGSTAPPIPEPSTLILFVVGVLGVSGIGYVRKRRQSAEL
jgi:hypothetical protein